jgi:2-dehydropantoate 2-reductase
MKICVFGAGAVGGHVAARLAQGGADISVVARQGTVDVVRERGLAVKTPDGDIRAQVAAATDARALGPQDAVIVTVKAPSLPEVAATITPLLGPRTPVVFAMNGIPWWYFHANGAVTEPRRIPLIDPDDVLWRAVGPERAIGAVVNSACTVLEPGVIRVAGRVNRLVLGEPDGSLSERLDALAQAMRAGGLAIETTQRIRDDIWEKLIVNLCNVPLTVLTQVTAKEVYSDPTCVATVRRVMAEAAAVATALGCDVRPDPERQIASGKAFDHKPSMAQDLELGRAMEIDSILTVPLQLARELKVATPTLDLLAALTKLRARAAGLYRG